MGSSLFSNIHSKFGCLLEENTEEAAAGKTEGADNENLFFYHK
jgi:hypothetical protein